MRKFEISKKLFHTVARVVAVALWAGCAAQTEFIEPIDLPDDRERIEFPGEQVLNIVGDGFDQQITRQLEETVDLSRHFRKLAKRPKQSLNTDAFDEVVNSSWFENRNALAPLSLAEVAEGNNYGENPEMTGKWTIIAAKLEGVTPGFHIKDSRGNRFVIKFDQPDYPELATGAEVVGSKLYHAAGYHVPQNAIVNFKRDKLVLGDGVRLTDEKGRKRLMTTDDIEKILNRIAVRPDGTIRAASSKYIPGRPTGPFRYEKVWKADPNDIVPHQHRRELRGLRHIAAWLNHFDTKGNNSYTSYVDEGYIKHWLIDFGSTLGSNGDEPMQKHIGHENTFDPEAMFLNLITLGLWVKDWEKEWEVKYPSVGWYEAKYFNPEDFKYINPNPAFELMTKRDGFWGAKIVMSFSDDQIRTAVAQGEYSNKEAEKYLADRIIQRRDIVGRYWFDRMNPVDKFRVNPAGQGKFVLCFEDLAVKHDLETAETTRYRYTHRRDGRDVFSTKTVDKTTCLPIPDQKSAPDAEWSIRIQTQHAGKAWSNGVIVFLNRYVAGSTPSLRGVLREE